MDITIDFESRSPIDIKKCGGYVYWAHPLTEVMMLSVKIDDGPTRVWIPPQFRGLKDTEISDEELKQAMDNADVVIAHNAAFERNGFKYGMGRFGFSPIPLEKIRDTSSQALMCALPRDLDSAAKYGLGGKEEKDATGHRLMLAMSKPRAFTKAEAIPLLPLLVERGFLPADATWQQAKKFQTEFISEFSLTGVGDQWLCENLIRYREGKEDYLRLVEYARQDVVVERELYKSLPRIPDAELKVYQWSETVNDRGIMVNIPVVRGIKKAVAGYAERLQQEALELTDGKVTSMKSPIAIKAWLEEHGCMVDSIDKGSVEYLLTLDLDPKVRRFLEIRRKLGKSSIAKYDALLNFSRTDGRFRGGFVYHAAGTGRFGGSGVQLQNLPRISESNSTSFKKAAPHFEDAEMLASGDTDLVEMFWKDPMVLASDCLRYMLRSPKGKRFISADYSAVECRGLAWLAGEESTLQAFREGKDIYKQAASGIYHIPYEEVDGGGKGPQRQIGKTAVLACLAGDTEVLTDKGWCAITDVTLTHKLWDGVEWVQHEGVFYSGLKKTVEMEGITLTPDHSLFDGTLWRLAINYLREPRCLRSGLSFGASSYLMLSLTDTIKNIERCVIKSAVYIADTRLGIGGTGFSNAIAASVSNARRVPEGLSKQDLNANLTALNRGLKLANSLLSRQKSGVGRATIDARIIASLCSVVAELLRIGSSKTILGMDEQLDALRALELKLGELIATLCRTGLCRYTRIRGFSRSWPASRTTRCIGAVTLNARAISTTASAGSSSASTIYAKLLRIISPCLIAVKKAIRLTESTMTGITKSATCASRHDTSKLSTSDASISSKTNSPSYENVYDILNAGPRHRFLIRGKNKKAVMAGNCGYGGGWGAMLRFGADKMGLSEEEGTNIVKAWRESNPNVTKLWYDLQKKSLEAMKFRHKRIPVRDNISFYAGNNFLTMRLPSGRDLFYPYAEVSECEMPWEDANGDVAKKKMVTCMFLTMAKQWVRRPLSHVTLTENLTQAACRDLLIHSAFNLEKAGYPVVMHVHDEVVCEVPEDFGSLEELEEIMARTPDWAKGFPLKAEGWVNWHYQK